MIRIYLDWNIYSYIKNPEHTALREKVKSLTEKAIFPYSSAHFKDLMKSYSEDNKYFDEDLGTLHSISKDHLLQWDEDKGLVRPYKYTPRDYFEQTKDDEDIATLLNFNLLESLFDDDLILKGAIGLFIGLLKSIPSGLELIEQTDANKEIINLYYPEIKSHSSMWDVIQTFGGTMTRMMSDKQEYLNLRNVNKTHGAYLKSDSGAWEITTVIDRVDMLVKDIGLADSFVNLIEKSLQLMKRETNLYNMYTGAYITLDMFGYKPDTLKGPSNTMMNVIVDGEHSLFGAHCDFFVVDDKKLRSKTKALYSRFNIKTKVLSSKEFVDEIDSHFSNINKLNDLYDIGCTLLDVPSGTKKYIPWLLNNFNSVETYHYHKENRSTLAFTRDDGTHSNFWFNSEIDNIFDTLIQLLVTNDNETILKVKSDFIEGKEKAETFSINWTICNYLTVSLQKIDEFFHPILLLEFDFDKVNKKEV